ncbi:MAG: class I SAM-dependent methyltransferase [Burkholderiales bacterium]|nr:class I SAM-dependent methyltransferase [Burkholderiales bacterium]
MPEVEEPLYLSAPLAWRIAQESCHTDPATGESCAWSHGMWQILRLIGLGSTASHRGIFYRGTIRKFSVGMHAPRVLISGTADYAMLAQVIAAFRGSDVRPAITVLDICETPLHLNRWYADRMMQPIDTVRQDILDYAPHNTFDLVCTDSFLGRFPHARWPALAKQWHALLRPGGIVVTASRLRGEDAPAAIGFPEKRAQALRDAVLRYAEKDRDSLGIDPAALARCAALYAGRHVNHPVRSADEVRALFEGAGFGLDEMTTASPETDQDESIRSPSMPSDARFLKLVARRL